MAIGVSWTMNSNHLKRRAVDFNLFVDDHYVEDCHYYAILGEYWESLDNHNVWGGNFNDIYHYERRNSIREAKKYRDRQRCR
jgi:peptidoglycan L-alanyl-D-glutamate endopeptidase CwlK